jgi:uncharacterized protein YjbI with pentapeptide repeats
MNTFQSRFLPYTLIRNVNKQPGQNWKVKVHMANEEQLSILKQGVKIWNEWRKENLVTLIKPTPPFLETHGFPIRANLIGADLRVANLNQIDLSETDLCGAELADADLSGANLTNADLWTANLDGANLRGARLWNAKLNVISAKKASFFEADLSRAKLNQADLGDVDFHRAKLIEADLSDTDFRGANLTEADLTQAYFIGTDLRGADLRGADLSGASLIRVRIDKAKISGSTIYGISAWDLEGEFAEQKDLVITPAPNLWRERIYNFDRFPEPSDPSNITVDNIKVAQFIYLILNNEELREAINTLTSKTVLILGRFAIPERKAILDALKSKLREYDLLPIVFDFDRPTDKDFTETIKTLAGLSYFVIADVTNPKSSPLELQATVPDYQIPFVPIIQEGEHPFAMMVDLQKKYNWVLDTLSYDSIETLIKALKPAIIDPAIQKHNELRLIKAREPKIRSANDFIEDKGLE